MAAMSLRHAVQARAMIGHKKLMAAVVEFFNGRYVEAEIIAGLSALRAARRQTYEQHWSTNAVRSDSKPVARVIVPQEAVEERERATSRPRSLTAELCGDPAFGRSALDRRHVA